MTDIKKIQKICTGGCEDFGGHQGEIKTVIVSGNKWKGFEFDYCENAIERDVKNGFKVEEIKDND